MAQIAVHPSSFYGMHDPLEDPIRDPKHPDTLRPPDAAPTELHERVKALRARVRRVYCAQLLAKLNAIVAQCRAWGVRVLVLPEYSVPWDVLPELARAVDETMVLVAGTHTVTRASRASKVYERLGGTNPRLGEAVCPVLHRGKLLALSAKLNPAKPEQHEMRPGDAWSPVEMPDGTPGPMGVLVCLDFLYRESPAYRAHVAEALRQCRFLAVPSLTPHHTLPEFESKAWEEARRYKRPVLYCDTAEGGGTAVYVDEGRAEDLRAFPLKTGLLERGDEGVIVCDVDLGYERRGESTGYDWERPALPFAAASLVYSVHSVEHRYAAWLTEHATRTEGEDDDALEAAAAAVEASRVLLTDAMSLSARDTRRRRLYALLRDAASVNNMEQLRRYSREVVLPPEVLPLNVLEGAMANAASETLFSWTSTWRGVGLDAMGSTLREASKWLQALERAEWTDDLWRAINAVERGVREPVEEKAPPAPVAALERPSLPTTFDPATFEDFEAHGWRFLFRRSVEDGRDLWTPKTGVKRVLGFDPDPEQPFVLARYGKEHGPLSVDRLVERLRLLAIAQGVTNSAVLFCVPTQGHRMMSASVLMACRDGWHLRHDASDGAFIRFGEVFLHALKLKDFGNLRLEPMHLEDLDAALPSLLPMVDGARATADTFRERKLREVSGVYIDTEARVDDQPPASVLSTFDEWLASDVRTALVLGSFGAGKSTALAEWCHRLWQRPNGVRPVLVNLAAAPPDSDPIGMLLDASDIAATPQHRAAMTLLVQRGHVLPCFDGFDELSTRATDLELPGRLRALLSVADGGGRVIVSSREHYFSHEQHLVETSRKALIDALGSSATWRRITILELTPAKVRTFVRETQGAERAAAVLARIETTYDLGDLVKRPLLLAMVLATIDRLDPKKRVATSDLYEQYLQRWLEQTRAIDGEVFSDDQKRAFAERLAVELWRTGASSTPWKDLDDAVTRHLGREVPVGLPHGAEWLEMRGGAFFVREGEDRYRFAHRSFLEYFFARALIEELPKNAGGALSTRPLTREVIAFVGEILSVRGAIEGSEAVRATQRWLTGGRARDGDDEELRATAGAAANALRLLTGLAQHVGSSAQWALEGSDLRRVRMARAELRGARLARVRLDGALLSGSDLREVTLTGASLVGAQMVACRLDGASLEVADMRDVVLQRAEAVEANFRGANLRGASLRASTWKCSEWEGALAEGAEVTEALGSVHKKRLPPALTTRIAEANRDRVQSVSWSPQGDRVVSGGDDGTVRLWDAASGVLLASLEGHRGGVNSVSWSLQGDRVASGGDDGTVRLWDTTSGALLATIVGQGGNVWSVSWSPQGDRVASGGADGKVRLWDAASGALLASLEGHGYIVWSVSWSTQGDRVASGGADGIVRLWDAASGALLASVGGHRSTVWSVSWSPQGNRVASGDDDGTVRLWDVASGALLATIKGHRKWVRSVSWSPQGDRVASGGDDGTVRLWDAVSGALLAAIKERGSFVNSVSWSPQGDRVASGGDDDTVRLWDAASGALLAAIKGHRNWVRSVSWSPQGDRVASGGDDGTVRLWDTTSGALLATIAGQGGNVWSVSWSPQGDRVASGGDDGTVRLWGATSGALLSAVEGQHDRVCSVSWSLRGDRVASGGGDGTVWLWDAASGTLLTAIDGRGGSVWSVSWSPQGDRVASGGEAGIVRLWGTASGALLASLEGHRGNVWSVSWSPQGDRVASGGADGTVRLWDAVSGALQTSLEGHRGIVWSVSWSPQGDRVASGGGDGTVRLWDAASGALQASLEGHRGIVWSVSWSPQGDRVASGGGDGTVRLWDATSGREFHADSDLRPASGERVAWSPEGDRVATIATDGTLRVLAIRLPRLRATLLASDDHTLTSTPEGYVIAGETYGERYVLAAPNPRTPTSELYLPFAPLREFFHRPDKVAALLRGEPVNTTPLTDLVAAGWTLDDTWDGGIVRVPESPVPSPLPAPIASAIQHAPVAPMAFSLGTAIERAEDLAGRDRQLEELLALIDRRQPSTLLGPRRSGKSSLLNVLEQRLREAERPHQKVSLEGKTLGSRHDLAVQFDPSLEGLPDAAGEFERRFKKRRDHVFLVDELKRLAELPPLDLGWFRNMTQNTGSFVLAGTHWDWRQVFDQSAKGRHGSPLNNFRRVVLGPLDDADAVAFLTTRAPADAPVSEHAARWAVEACDGWPYYLQLIQWELAQRSRSGNREAHNSREAMFRLVKRLLPVAAEDTFESRWDELPAVIREFLVSGREVSDLSRDTRQIFVRTGLFTEGVGTLKDRPFFDWIRLNAGRLPLTPDEDA